MCLSSWLIITKKKKPIITKLNQSTGDLINIPGKKKKKKVICVYHWIWNDISCRPMIYLVLFSWTPSHRIFLFFFGLTHRIIWFHLKWPRDEFIHHRGGTHVRTAPVICKTSPCPDDLGSCGPHKIVRGHVIWRIGYSLPIFTRKKEKWTSVLCWYKMKLHLRWV